LSWLFRVEPTIGLIDLARVDERAGIDAFVDQTCRVLRCDIGPWALGIDRLDGWPYRSLSLVLITISEPVVQLQDLPCPREA
jgi:hypothetical protein